MIKRAIPLFLAASLLSVLLLIVGTAVMNTIDPVFASQLPALIAGQSGKEPVIALLPADNKNLDRSQNVTSATPKASETPSATPLVSKTSSATPQVSKTPSATSGTKPTLSPSKTQVPLVNLTIAKLLANPSSYLDRLFTVTGRITLLSSNKFLINDGTGQIIVDLSDLVKITITSGTTLTVVGELDKNDNGSGFHIDARTLTGISGIASTSIPKGGGCNCDDCNDGCDDDCNDDCNDDCDDDSDDDSNDDSNDDSDDDSDDDQED